MTKLSRSQHDDRDANSGRIAEQVSFGESRFVNRGQLDDDLPTSTPCDPRGPEDDDGRRDRPPTGVRRGGKENQETFDELPDAHVVGSKRGG